MASTPIRPRRTRSASANRESGKFADSFALLAECLLTGVYILIGSLPVITLPAALAAGVAHLRRHIDGQDTQIGRFARDWWAAVRDLWTLGVAAVVLAALLAGNFRIAESGLLPGGDVVPWLSLAAGAFAAIIVLRTAGLWAATHAGLLSDGGRTALPSDGDRSPTRPDAGPPAATHPTQPPAAPPTRRTWDLARRAARSVGDDLGGSLLLGVALGLSGVLVWMLTPLVAIVGGLLSLAVIAVDARHSRTSRTNNLP